MSSHLKQRLAEPSIVVDPNLASPSWTSEETVLFRRDMLPLVQPPKKRTRLRPALLVAASVLLILCAIALRLWLQR